MNDTEDTHEVPLTDRERARFAELEETIDLVTRSFIIRGDALREIRDERLYRESHDTFHEYCQARFRLTRPKANQLIDSARCGNSLSQIAHVEPPTSECQVRPLEKLSEKVAAEAWTHASLAKQRPITEKMVRKSLGQVLCKPRQIPTTDGVVDKLLQACSDFNSDLLRRGYSTLTPKEVSALSRISDIISQTFTGVQLSSFAPPLENGPSGEENQKDNP